MQVFLLGGSGLIGTAMVRALLDAGHHVTALSRTPQADAKLAAIAAGDADRLTVQRGDLRAPQDWAGLAVAQDAIIHLAATFTDDMGTVDHALVAALLAARQDQQQQPPPRLLYTGGCWVYGQTGDHLAREDHGFDPPPHYGWMVDHGRQLLASDLFVTAVVHPAMVYGGDGGMLAPFMAAIKAGQPAEIWGSAAVRWPLIHRDDVARAYLALLTRPDQTGWFNAVAEAGVPVGTIVAHMRDHARANGMASPAPTVLSAEDLWASRGDWAAGPLLDQGLSADKLRAATGWAPQITDYRYSDLFDPANWRPSAE